MILFLVGLMVKFLGVNEISAVRYARLFVLVLMLGGLLLTVMLIGRACDNYERNKNEKIRRQIEANIRQSQLNEGVLETSVNDASSLAEKANRDALNAKERLQDAKSTDVNKANTNANDALKRFRCEVEGKCD